VGPLDDLTLMKRIDAIAYALGTALPQDPHAAWEAMRSVLPDPLSENDKTFNDGYWMLPLAAYWSAHHISNVDVSLSALEELTQRGTAEFAVRPFVNRYPEKMRATLERWVAHESFHVRRLASEGTRPNLPWAGRLRVEPEWSVAFFKSIAPLAHDPVAYVRRSVGNHARDLRRIDAAVVETWERDDDPPADVRKRAAARSKKRDSRHAR
jgi:3-methyladenine DNA glycosylase AlkC